MTNIKENKVVKKLSEIGTKVKGFYIKHPNITSMLVLAIIAAFVIIDPTFAAAGYKTKVTNIVTKMIEIIGYVFQVVGVILAVYSVGQLVMAFKNEDADSKTRASTQLVISVILIGLPLIITSLKLTDELK